MRPGVEIDLSTLFSETAKISELAQYKETALKSAGEGAVITLTGRLRFGSI